MPLTATIRRAAEQDTLALPFRVPAREWFTLRQAGELLGLAESTVEKLYDRGELTGHSHNAGDGLRAHKRVLRCSLIAYAVRTADYTDDSLADAMIACLRWFPSPLLVRIASAATKLLQEQGNQSTTGSARPFPRASSF